MRGNGAAGNRAEIPLNGWSYPVSPETIRGEIGSISSMREAVNWAQGRTSPCAFVNAVAQDEFTHDVIVRVSDHLFVVFDTT